MDVYYTSPVLPSNTTRQCSISGCSHLLSNELNTMCGEQEDTQPFPSTSDPSPLPPSHSAPLWTQPIDLFSTLAAHLAASSVPLSVSDLANALLLPTTEQAIQPQLPTLLPNSESTRSPVVGNNAEVMRTDESKAQRGEQLENEASQMRVCSVRACKQTVPVGHEYKMCPACRIRYQKYGTTKRAKWKVEREKEKEKQKASTVTDGSEVPRAPNQPQPSDMIEDTGDPNIPLAIPLDTPGGTTEERDHITTTVTAPNQQPSRLSADQLIPSVQLQPLPQMHHQRHPYSSSSFVHDQVRRLPSNPSATGYLESDPIVNGFSKFRVELFEGELDGRQAAGAVMSAPHVMKLSELSNTSTDPPAPVSPVSLRRKYSSGEDHTKDASGMESREKPGSNGNMTKPIVPVSLTVCHPVTSESKIHVAACGPAQAQHDSQSQSTKDGPSDQPASTTPVPAPKTKGKRRPKAKPSTTPSTTGASPPSNTAPPHPGYSAPHPYLYPYYPMYFPPYPGAYQYPYFPMPFAAPSPSPKTKRKRKPSQVAETPPAPLPLPLPPGSAYPYPPPGHSGAWAYPTPTPPPPPPPPIQNSSRQESAGVSPVDAVPPLQSPPPPLAPTPAASAVYAVPYSLPPSQGQCPPHPIAHSPYPHLSGTQPYSGTPLTTLMPVPFFPAAALSSVSGSSRRDKGKETGSATKDDSGSGGSQFTCGGMMGNEYQINVKNQQQQPHVQMQFNYYHYGMGTSQSPTTPETHTRKKRRKVDPNYREKMEMLRAQATVPAPVPAPAPTSATPSAPTVANPSSSSSSSTAPEPSTTQGQTPTNLTPLEKQPVGNGNLDDSESTRPSTSTLRRCSNKGCTRALPNVGNHNAICKKCKIKFKKMMERTKERFRLVPKRSVCDILGK